MTEPIQQIPGETLRSIDQALATWDRAAAATRVEKAERLRTEFVERFPLSTWPTLPVESYALGQGTDGDTVSRWLEFKTREIASMSGGSSYKHLIFKGSGGDWKYPPKRYASVEEAWQAVRAGFVRCFELAAAGRVDEIFGIEALYGAPALRTKALYMYFPEKFVPVCSFKHLHHFLDLLGQPYDSNWILGTNVKLLNTLQSIPALSGMGTQELGYFLYHWADPRSATHAYKVAPGELGRFWDDCLSGGYICVGWDRIGDLAAFATKDEFRLAFRDAYGAEYLGNESSITRKSNELWTLMTLEPGDKVIANRGIGEILAVGTVTDGGYRFRPDRAEYQHTVEVEWDTSLARTIPPVGAWRTTTVRKVDAKQYREWFGHNDDEPVVQPIAVDDVYTNIEQALERRGQVILYGPPGTGKTFYARRAAVWFLDGGSGSKDASTALVDEQRLLDREQQLGEARDTSPQVWFMVASPQQWAWENLFQDGGVEYAFGRLQRNYPNVRAGDLVVGYESTPTKRIVALARVTGEYDPTGNPSKAIALEPIVRIQDGLTYDDLKNDPILANSEPMRFRCQGSLFALTASEADRLLVRLNEADPGMAKYAQPSTSRLTRITFHPSYTYEDFIEGFRPLPSNGRGLELRLTDGIFKKVCAAAAAAPDQRFVVLIDEINRGNIPKIFGELITLVEHDKRGLSIRLPQSGEDFSVPKNVFIIGTMNTADRSIQLLDTALRRRFRFIEQMPDSDALNEMSVGGLPLGVFLDGLNDHVRRKVGRERQIGHALFFQNGKVINTPEAFSDVFRHELLPLLQEYLYDSYADLADILGSEVVDRDAERVTAVLDDPAALCATLAQKFGGQSAQ